MHHAKRKLPCEVLAREDGFGLVETTVALALAMTAIVALGMTLASGLRAVRTTRFVQQGTGIARSQIDLARDLEFDEVVMVQGDLTGDPDVLTGNRYDPDGTGPLEAEDLVVATGGGEISPHLTMETTQGKTYSVARYVTWVDADAQGGAGTDYKRLTVVVTWTVGSQEHTHRASTLLARARAGLPTPRFEVRPVTQTFSTEPGTVLTFPFTIRNIGLRDTYDLTMPAPSGRTWNVLFYKDSDADGVYDAGSDPLLTDTNATGIVDSGNVNTGETYYLVGVLTLSATEPSGTETMEFSATAGSHEGYVESGSVEVTVGGAGLELWLHDNPTPPTGDSASNKNMDMDEIAPTAVTLRKYSTDYYTGQPGRFVDKKDAAADESDKKFMGNWVFQLAQATTFDGDAEATIWVAMKDHACDKTPTLKFYLRHKSSASTSSGTTLASATVTSPSSSGCGLRAVTVTLPVNTTISANRWLELKVVALASSADAVLLGYDTTTYNASLTMPRVTT